jgi:hypothetical protein
MGYIWIWRVYMGYGGYIGDMEGMEAIYGVWRVYRGYGGYIWGMEGI